MATHLAGPDHVSVTKAAGGQSLETLLGRPLEENLTGLTLIPASTGIYWAEGVATVMSPPLPGSGISQNVTKANADLWKFFAASTIKMQVIQEG